MVNKEEMAILTVILSILSIPTAIYLNLFISRFILRTYSGILDRRNLPRRARLLSLIGIKEDEGTTKKFIIGFLHPYCNAGGGGERVLWTAVALHQRTEPDTICAIYTGDLGVTKLEIIQKVKSRFGITLDPKSLLLVPLKTRYLVEASTWPRCTLLGQSLGSIVLGYEALSALIPDIYIDTMGYAFTFPVFRLLTSIPIGAYVHYPTISNDMLNRVSKRNSTHNNSDTISKSIVLSYLKLIYYIIFAELYSLCLRQADHLMVNSTWTKNHIDSLLKPWLHRTEIEEEEEERMNSSEENTSSRKRKESTSQLRSRIPAQIQHDNQDSPRKTNKIKPEFAKSTIVYPPCDVQSFIDFPINKERKLTILSISQFRPEKDQITQIQAFSKFLKSCELKNYPQKSQIKLILCGSCRDDNKDDLLRVESLKKLVNRLNVEKNVEFKVNVSWDSLKSLLSQSLVGISTMVDEHFGISVVEFMASGLIPLVHRSGGPLLDIVVPLPITEDLSPDKNDTDQQTRTRDTITGFHADGILEYSTQLEHIFCTLNDHQRIHIQDNARKLALLKFGTHQFETSWIHSFKRIVRHPS
ncbi:hypothetical protein MJO28_000715 [Puccinia striiformis f. sp. tritici]|uniref:GDP-Man:Man(3)GlcNAc(2)-PP-Dol alpha-1,2-mannosyltransferase n=3 Tax=Puccinia striiformis TaxID=27350 RepID=A0A0L0V273_9BASI|nr:hypothetical protein Pst134EA_000529 [Puccinia striiformis f. sp. tritici]KAI9601255.1 hypothetical protein H4Q26_001067 [Puccinia striiformis f. sp. tritici PST-130]KNE93393.1 hypothetical protein PSTG_13216 [Puccinia striiformis f. sp. tritici PST-78]POW07550.1 hypothetical protein PSTT_08135 [Puccinia striiformis]KAH9466669.1 hypothetical protein Pst134EB_001719 [Puccinia striiformis f. sp. tritici]KAH9473456.1 hypothetical protein Pst134EA_000529 [Puccinia striiformis f. sp. tritici]